VAKAVLLAVGVAVTTPAGRPAPVELRKETFAAFERYAKLTEARIEKELREQNPFLRVDALPAVERQAAYEKLRRGEIVVERLRTLDNGKEIEIPHGMVHHWVGTVFIPGATVDQTLALVQDYDRHQEVYKPDVQASKLLSREGDDFKAFLRFKKKKVITVVLNTVHEAHYARLSPTRAYSSSHTTRVNEVENPGAPDEREKPQGNDGGFLWHIYTYWRFEERTDDIGAGTYVQCESISLTRDIPVLLSWLIKPFVTGVPRESLEFTLGATRSALMPKSGAAPPEGTRH
jgi:hypothetical protein